MQKRAPSIDDDLPGDVGRGEAQVGCDNGTASELLVGVRGPDSELAGVVDDGERGEAVLGAELVAPAGADRVGAAHVAGRVRLAGRLGAALDGEGARGRGADVGVDRERPGAACVRAVAHAL